MDVFSRKRHLCHPVHAGIMSRINMYIVYTKLYIYLLGTP